ncbi:MAG: hypothetical protein QOJ42_1268 [Acidobacteriaceae bacterium]|jgi:hypothetical protein|nr:hypothetical protein [Acidobacteriaceae bacterium]MDX6456939.1 hypothetical protein [Acidobacteriaceae bacterium]MEA3006912.1 hypothetical protein [Acidobacteriaceae bacterium]
MKRILAVTTLSIAVLMMMDNPLLHAQETATTATPKKTVVFACNMKAMSPEERKRQSEVLSPGLRASKLSSKELADGYEFQFPSDAKTYQMVAEWIGNERLCCPFFDFDLRVGDASAPMSLKISGPEGVKQFIRAELAAMVG